MPVGLSCRNVAAPTVMKQTRIGKSTLSSSSLAFGCWRIAGTWEARKVTAKARDAGLKAIFAAHEAGYTLYDHADIYCGGVSEELFGLALKRSKELSKSSIIATKCGILIPEGIAMIFLATTSFKPVINHFNDWGWIAWIYTNSTVLTG